MSAESESYGGGEQALDRLADLLLFPERFREDPQSALEAEGLAGAIPDEVLNALSSASPDELRLLANVRRTQVQQPNLGKSLPRYGIIF